MKYLLIVAAMQLVLGGTAFSQSEKFIVTVQYETKNIPSKLYLNYNQVVDSASPKKGVFTFIGCIEEPVQAVVREPLSSFSQEKYFFIDNGGALVIVKDSIGHAEIKNSPVNEMAVSYNKFISREKSNYDQLSAELRASKIESEKINKRPGVKQAFNLLQEKQVKYVQQNPSSWMSVIALSDILFSYAIENLDSAMAAKKFIPVRQMYDQLDEKIRKTASGQELKNKITGLLNGQVGSPVIHFAQAGHDGKIVDIADYKGKYFLIDFWGSWCVWCRKGHPHLKELYNRYHEKGFEIIAVSKEFGEPDDQRKNWLDAIQKDDIPWKHILEMPGNELTKKYAITAYPTKFLFDPSGKIILRVGDDNEKKLDKILEEIYQ